MTMLFIPPPEENAALSAALDPQHRKLRFPHSEPMVYRGRFGEIITQHFSASDFSITQHHMFIRREVTLSALTPEPILAINYMLEGTPVANLEGLGGLPLHAGTYRMFYVPAAAQTVTFAAGSYHCLHVNFAPAYLGRMADYSETIRSMLDGLRRGSNAIIAHEAGPMDTAIRTKIEEIRLAPFVIGELELQLRTRMVDLLLLYLHAHHLGAAKSSWSLEQVRRIREYITDNLDRTLRVGGIAVALGMSEASLRRAFHLVSDLPPYQYFQRCRMERAAALLLEGRGNITEIAFAIGYQEPATFTHAFVRHYGITPLRFIRDHQMEEENRKE